MTFQNRSGPSRAYAVPYFASPLPRCGYPTRFSGDAPRGVPGCKRNSTTKGQAVTAIDLVLHLATRGRHQRKHGKARYPRSPESALSLLLTIHLPVHFRFRPRIFVWLVLFAALAGPSERNRLQLPISMSLERQAPQQLATPRELRLQKRRSTTADRDRGRARP